MCDDRNMVEKTVKISADIYKTLEIYQILTKKPMEKILYESVRTGARQIRAQLNELPHTNMNKIIEAHGLNE